MIGWAWTPKPYKPCMIKGQFDLCANHSLYEDLGLEAVPPYYLSPIPGMHYPKAMP